MTPDDLELLRFAGLRWRHAGLRESAIRDRFGISATHYYQAVNRIIDDEQAIRERPELVLPLRRVREQRARLKRAS